MSTNWILIIVVVAIAIGGFAYYQHRQNTVLEVGVGTHTLSVQKN